MKKLWKQKDRVIAITVYSLLFSIFKGRGNLGGAARLVGRKVDGIGQRNEKNCPQAKDTPHRSTQHKEPQPRVIHNLDQFKSPPVHATRVHQDTELQSPSGNVQSPLAAVEDEHILSPELMDDVLCGLKKI